ncbi:MAG: hypothetical protein LM586_04960 [Desulfurococcales archaeon]|jgi:hypothetical protein|nr:hypothetical protein [Desulfurococcales archaeon]MCC6062813.1 hypothetical protein [Desulfurococcales archaeon]
MSSAEIFRRKIITYIEENKDPLIKAAFYSDEEVMNIMRSLTERWERSGFQGVPLDYATYEELKILAEKAEYYKDAPRETFLRKIFREEFSD